MKRIVTIFLLPLLASCAIAWKQPEPVPAGAAILNSSHDAVSRLLAQVPADKPLDPALPVIVASLVNIDDLASSRLGRMVAEQLMTGLVANGYTVTELKLRSSIYIRRNEGELMLSREIPEISKKHAAQAVLLGTYTPSLHNLYITVKLVGVTDNQVIASHDYVLPMDGEVRSLLWARSGM